MACHGAVRANRSAHGAGDERAAARDGGDRARAASATTAARRGTSSRCPTSTGCSCAGAKTAAGAVLPAVLLMGPTASGKSALALALARALRRRDRQRRLRAGLSRHGHRHREARRRRRARASPHHLIDIVDPTRGVLGRALRRATRCAAIADIRARGRMPILVGGTMLYFKALTRGPVGAAARPTPRVRAELDARAAREGWPALHAELARVDPATAARLRAHRCAAHPARARGASR